MPEGIPPISISSTTTLENRTGSWKYIRPVYRDRVAPCNEGCPVGIDIEGYMNLLREGHADAACDLLLRENPLPATTGRVCYHPCEVACNRGHLDGAVSIRAVERMLGDRALQRPPPPSAQASGRSVAVVGSGPAGLACAYHLARLGHAVAVFEAAPEPGGMLRLGIPDYRLPLSVLEAEIGRIRSLGVEIHCGVRLGRDMAWKELEHFDAVFLATGAHRSRSLELAGEDVAGVESGLDFLRRVKLGERPEVGKTVVVVGGGNTAIDCARTAWRLGAAPVVLYRRTRAEMPAIDEEVAEAQREGVAFRFLAAPAGIETRDGRLVGLTCVRMALGEADASGRRRPSPIPGSEFFVRADTVLTAIGEEAGTESWPEGIGVTNGGVTVTTMGATTLDRTFAGGDVIDQPRTVAHALGSGKRAALAIDARMRGEGAGSSVDEAALRYGRLGNVSMTRWRADDPISRNGATNEVVPFEDLNLDHYGSVPRHEIGLLPLQESRSLAAEVNPGLPRDLALEEAVRCFNCGVCNQCDLCMIFCPDLAISRRADGTGFSIDYDYCKGCGVCNAECPRGAMAMTREGL